jgi:hypothetical protein
MQCEDQGSLTSGKISSLIAQPHQMTTAQHAEGTNQDNHEQHGGPGGAGALAPPTTTNPTNLPSIGFLNELISQGMQPTPSSLHWTLGYRERVLQANGPLIGPSGAASNDNNQQAAPPSSLASQAPPSLAMHQPSLFQSAGAGGAGVQFLTFQPPTTQMATISQPSLFQQQFLPTIPGAGGGLANPTGHQYLTLHPKPAASQQYHQQIDVDGSFDYDDEDEELGSAANGRQSEEGRDSGLPASVYLKAKRGRPSGHTGLTLQEKNRRAQQKFRARKKLQVEIERQMYGALENENEILRGRVARLESALAALTGIPVELVIERFAGSAAPASSALGELTNAGGSGGGAAVQVTMGGSAAGAVPRRSSGGGGLMAGVGSGAGSLSSPPLRFEIPQSYQGLPQFVQVNEQGQHVLHLPPQQQQQTTFEVYAPQQDYQILQLHNDPFIAQRIREMQMAQQLQASSGGAGLQMTMQGQGQLPIQLHGHHLPLQTTQPSPQGQQQQQQQQQLLGPQMVAAVAAMNAPPLQLHQPQDLQRKPTVE